MLSRGRPAARRRAESVPGTLTALAGGGELASPQLRRAKSRVTALPLTAESGHAPGEAGADFQRLLPARGAPGRARPARCVAALDVDRDDRLRAEVAVADPRPLRRRRRRGGRGHELLGLAVRLPLVVVHASLDALAVGEAEVDLE